MALRVIYFLHALRQVTIQTVMDHKQPFYNFQLAAVNLGTHCEMVCFLPLLAGCEGFPEEGLAGWSGLGSGVVSEGPLSKLLSEVLHWIQVPEA